MMNPLTVFDFEDTVVRSLVIDNEPWFVGKDICSCLGITNNRKTLATLDSDEKGVTYCDTLGGRQEMTVINECGVYHLIFRSRKPQAQRFRRWVLHEVLPSIRKTGQYQTTQVNLEDMGEKLRLVQEARRVYGKKPAQSLWESLGLPAVLTSAETKQQADRDSLLAYLRAFLNECLIEDQTSRISSGELYKLYCNWAAVCSAPYFTIGHFGKLLSSNVGLRRMKASTTFYCGYRVNADFLKKFGLKA